MNKRAMLRQTGLALLPLPRFFGLGQNWFSAVQKKLQRLHSANIAWILLYVSGVRFSVNTSEVADSTSCRNRFWRLAMRYAHYVHVTYQIRAPCKAPQSILVKTFFLEPTSYVYQESSPLLAYSKKKRPERCLPFWAPLFNTSDKKRRQNNIEQNNDDNNDNNNNKAACPQFREK